MEIVEIDDWKSYNENVDFPKGIIYCPLHEDALKLAYSINCASRRDSSLDLNMYIQQIEAYKVEMRHPSLHQHQCAPKSIKPLEALTIDSYSRAMDEFVGFCSLHLDCVPTMDLIMYPQLIAKYMGFHVARGNSPSTLNKIARQLMRGIWFVISSNCPNITRAYNVDTTKEVVDWLTCLEHATHHAIPIHTKFTTCSTTLYQVWQCIDTKWETFISHFEVSRWHASVWS